MKKLLLTVLMMFCFSCLVGCASFSNRHSPTLESKMTERAVEPAPVIMASYELHSLKDGNIVAPGGVAGRSTERLYAKVFLKALQKSPIMRKASEAPTEDVNYVLLLDVINKSGDPKWISLSVITLTIIPGFMSGDQTVRGTLYEAANGQQVASYEASMDFTMVSWLGLLPVMPVNLIMRAAGAKETADEWCLADIFVQMSETIKNRPMPAAIPASRIKIEENPDSGKRSVKIAGT